MTTPHDRAIEAAIQAHWEDRGNVTAKMNAAISAYLASLARDVENAPFVPAKRVTDKCEELTVVLIEEFLSCWEEGQLNSQRLRMLHQRWTNIRDSFRAAWNAAPTGGEPS